MFPQDPSRLVKSEFDLASDLRRTLKALFDVATAKEPPGVKPLGPISALLIETNGNDLDAETIWQELQLRDAPLLRWVT